MSGIAGNWYVEEIGDEKGNLYVAGDIYCGGELVAGNISGGGSGGGGAVTIPAATTQTLGGIIVGQGLTVQVHGANPTPGKADGQVDLDFLQLGLNTDQYNPADTAHPVHAAAAYNLGTQAAVNFFTRYVETYSRFPAVYAETDHDETDAETNPLLIARDGQLFDLTYTIGGDAPEIGIDTGLVPPGQTAAAARAALRVTCLAGTVKFPAGWKWNGGSPPMVRGNIETLIGICAVWTEAGGTEIYATELYSGSLS